jgi:hypothetical protein
VHWQKPCVTRHMQRNVFETQLTKLICFKICTYIRTFGETVILAHSLLSIFVESYWLRVINFGSRWSAVDCLVTKLLRLCLCYWWRNWVPLPFLSSVSNNEEINLFLHSRNENLYYVLSSYRVNVAPIIHTRNWRCQTVITEIFRTIVFRHFSYGIGRLLKIFYHYFRILT